MSKLSVTQRIDKFGELIRDIGQGMVEAGKYLVALLEDDPTAKRQIMARFPHIGPSVLNQLEAIGRGQLHHELAMTSLPGYVKLRGLPMSDQERYLNDPVELLVEKDGSHDQLLVMVKDLTPDQAKQVFATDHVRTIPAQRAWLEDAKAHAAMLLRSDEFDEPYKIHKDGTVEFRKAVRMSAGQMADILAKITKR